MPPEYHLESFWDDRFKKEDHFEWLGDGSNTILPPIRKYLQTEYARQPPRVLHIGAGTSTLSGDILKLYKDHFRDGEFEEGLVVNTDYSEVAVERGKSSHEENDKQIRWEKTDLMLWEEIRSLKRAQEHEAPFEIVVDKSTSDAISCNENIKLVGPKTTRSDACPPISNYFANGSDRMMALEPVELLALHTAALVRPRGIWIALSYSKYRFHFLEQLVEEDKCREVAASRYWELEEVVGVDAPSGSRKEGVFAPVIQHYVFVLRRTDRQFEF